MRFVFSVALVFLTACKYDTPNRSNLFLEIFLYSAPWMAVATGTNCTGWTSVDAKTWQSFQFPGCTTGTIASVAFGADKFVAVGSTDGTTCATWTGTGVYALEWTRNTCGPATLRMTAVAFGSGSAGQEFVAAGMPSSATTFAAISSQDGITWSDATITDAGGAGAPVQSIVFWPTGQQFVESQQTNQNTQRRSIGAGTTWIAGNATGVTPPKLLTGPTSSNGTMRLYNWGNSPSVVQYDDAGYASGYTNLSPNVFSAAIPVVNDGVHGEGKRTVFVRDNCGVTYLTSASGADTSGAYTMSGCTTSNIKAVGYIEPYFIAGSDDGSFYYSVSGLPSEWTRATSSGSTSVTQKIAGRPGVL